VGSVREIVDQQIQPHARRHPEDGRQSQTDRVRMLLEDGPLGRHLVPPVERNRSHGRFLRAELPLLTNTVPAVRDRDDDALVAPDLFEHPDNCLFIGGRRRQRIPIAERSAHERCQRDDDVCGFQQRAHRLVVTHIPADELEARVVADGRQAVLTEHEVVDNGHVEATLEQLRHENGTDITAPASHQHTVHSPSFREVEKKSPVTSERRRDWARRLSGRAPVAGARSAA
jgi:hypothetical protein